jgi:hypothetical protein
MDPLAVDKLNNAEGPDAVPGVAEIVNVVELGIERT